jgi:hypothetical protein
MKKVELKKFCVGSVFKVIMYMLIIPIALCFIISLIAIIIGLVTQEYEVVGIGVLMGIGYPIIFVLAYGLFGTLMALLYNGLAGKFGGLELMVSEIDESTRAQVKIEDPHNTIL